MQKVIIFTDGACRGNPGNGGYGCVLLYKDAQDKIHRQEFSQGYKNTTNNRMELMAVIKSLALLTRPCEVEIYSDSAYVVNAFNQNWIVNWQRNGWKNSAKAEVANKDLWTELLRLTAIHKVTFVKVKGHADNEFNNRCDELAVEQSRKYAKES